MSKFWSSLSTTATSIFYIILTLCLQVDGVMGYGQNAGSSSLPSHRQYADDDVSGSRDITSYHSSSGSWRHDQPKSERRHSGMLSSSIKVPKVPSQHDLRRQEKAYTSPDRYSSDARDHQRHHYHYQKASLPVTEPERRRSRRNNLPGLSRTSATYRSNSRRYRKGGAQQDKSSGGRRYRTMADIAAYQPAYVHEVPDEDWDRLLGLDVQADEPDDNHLEAFEAALHHIEEMSSCSAARCKDPQPFVQFMHDPFNRNVVFMPQCTILHRCMNFTGCCGDSSRECVPKKSMVIRRAFLVMDLSAGGEDYLSFDPTMARMIELVNHTECECREKPRMKRCMKRCPVPFRVMRDGHDCNCNCQVKADEDHWQCEKVKEGVVPLSIDGLVCIKEGNCYNPVCILGEFDVKSGYCPLSDKYSLPSNMFKNAEDRYHYRRHLRNFDYTRGTKTSVRTYSGSMPAIHEPKRVKEKRKLEKRIQIVKKSRAMRKRSELLKAKPTRKKMKVGFAKKTSVSSLQKSNKKVSKSKRQKSKVSEEMRKLKHKGPSPETMSNRNIDRDRETSVGSQHKSNQQNSTTKSQSILSEANTASYPPQPWIVTKTSLQAKLEKSQTSTIGFTSKPNVTKPVKPTTMSSAIKRKDIQTKKIYSSSQPALILSTSSPYVQMSRFKATPKYDPYSHISTSPLLPAPSSAPDTILSFDSSKASILKTSIQFSPTITASPPSPQTSKLDEAFAVDENDKLHEDREEDKVSDEHENDADLSSENDLLPSEGSGSDAET